MARGKGSQTRDRNTSRIEKHKPKREPTRRSSRLLHALQHCATTLNEPDHHARAEHPLTPSKLRKSNTRAASPHTQQQAVHAVSQKALSTLIPKNSRPRSSKRQAKQPLIKESLEYLRSSEREEPQIDWVEGWVEDSIAETPDQIIEEKFINEHIPRGGFAKMPSDYSGTQNSTQTSGPYDPGYYRILQDYDVYVEIFPPPRELFDQVQTLLLVDRTTKMDTAQAQHVSRLSRECRTVTEQRVITTFPPTLFPFWTRLPTCIFQSEDMPWTDAFPLDPSSRVQVAQPVSVPKPDATFSIAPVGTLSESQERAANSLLVDNSCFAMPDRRGGWFPFLTMEFKAVATKGTRYVGTGQASLAGAVMLRTLSELFHRATGECLFAKPRPLFFSLVMDHEIAAVNFHWLGFERGKITMNLEQVCICALRKSEDVQLLQRTMQNILDWAEKVYIPWVCELLDKYSERSKVHHVGPMAPPTLTSFKRRRSKRDRATSSANSTIESSSHTSDKNPKAS